MTTRVRVFTRDGVPLAELDVNLQRTWLLSRYGEANFLISPKDLKATEPLLQFGNIVLAEHTTIQPWVGVIDTPREWSDGLIKVNLHSAEYLLNYRITGMTEAYTDQYGSIFKSMINAGNSADDFNLLEVGDVYLDSLSVTKLYNYANVYESIIGLSDQSGYEWGVEPSIAATGKLILKARWAKRFGSNINFTLQDGWNIKLESSMLQEQGMIYNMVNVYGKGDPFANKPVGTAIDYESIGKYGSRAMAVYADANNVDQLNNIAAQTLAAFKAPRRTFAVSGIDVDGAFAQCRLGNILSLKYFSVGFGARSTPGATTTVRIRELSYQDVDNVLGLTVDEIIGVKPE